VKAFLAFVLAVLLFDAVDRAEFPERASRPLLVHTHRSNR
jgi:hypothetical protein